MVNYLKVKLHQLVQMMIILKTPNHAHNRRTTIFKRTKTL